MALKKLDHRYKAYANIGTGCLEHKLERNDCVVRALALASGIAYDVIHALLAKHGRPEGRGTSWKTHREAVKEINGSVMFDVPFDKTRQPTLNQFVADHPKGCFFVIRRGHAFAVINGKVYDWQYTDTGERSKILYAAEFVY